MGDRWQLHDVGHRAGHAHRRPQGKWNRLSTGWTAAPSGVGSRPIGDVSQPGGSQRATHFLTASEAQRLAKRSRSPGAAHNKRHRSSRGLPRGRMPSREGMHPSSSPVSESTATALPTSPQPTEPGWRGCRAQTRGYLPVKAIASRWFGIKAWKLLEWSSRFDDHSPVGSHPGVAEVHRRCDIEGLGSSPEIRDGGENLGRIRQSVQKRSWARGVRETMERS